MVLGDRIAAVGRHDGPAREVLDARGMLVTPGFVDVHTHLDAQLTWDPSGDPVCWHGITSVVVGNCGVGFAPCRPADRDYLMFLMEGVEDVPRAAMAAGMRWAWEGFGDYLRRSSAVRSASTSARTWRTRRCACGRWASAAPCPTRRATASARRCGVRSTRRSPPAALGVSSGRTTMHRTPAGDAVPGTFAGRDELWALAAPLARRGTGVVQVVPYGTAGVPRLPRHRGERPDRCP